MSILAVPRRLATDLVVAFQFLTRLPMPRVTFSPNSLARSSVYFPVVGLILGLGAALLHALLVPHLNRTVSGLGVILFLVLVTGGLHEDGLADVADGFGGGRDREQILRILRDSRIGTYGGLALCFSLASRVLLLSSMPLAHVTRYLVAAETLSRWSALPLTFLPASRVEDGQGARLAQGVSRSSLVVGSLLAACICALALHRGAFMPVALAVVITALCARYFMRRIDGTTGDCFGATIQLTAIAVYCCGAWVA